MKDVAIQKTGAEGLSRWKVILFSIVLVAGVLVVLEGIASAYLRITRGYDGKHLYQYSFDSYKNILPAPNYVDTRGIRHNSQGFRRNEDVIRKKPAGTFRIFLVGGSTAYGLGGLWPHLFDDYPVIDNAETIDAFLERELGDAFPEVHVEVINAAVTSTWTHHSLIYINQTLLNYSPDMILFLDGVNDFFFWRPTHDQFADYSYSLPGRIIMGPPTLKSLVYANGWWLFRKSALAHVVGRALRIGKLLIKRQQRPPPMHVQEQLAGMTKVFQANALRMHRRSALILGDEGVSAVMMMQPMLILERAKAKPPAEEKLFEFNVSSRGENYESYLHQAADTAAKYEELMAEQTGATFIDLTHIFDQVPDQVFTDYAHLTPAGNRILADSVADRIIPLIRQHMSAESRH